LHQEALVLPIAAAPPHVTNSWPVANRQAKTTERYAFAQRLTVRSPRQFNSNQTRQMKRRTGRSARRQRIQTMKRALKHAVAAIILVLSFAAPVVAGSMQDAIAAYGSGDYATALRLIRPLANQGYAAAQYDLGIMYDNGQGVPQNYAEAVKWYRLAADQGYADAQSDLGAMYEHGRGVPQNYAEAGKWYRKAADQGAPIAQYNLGGMYQTGRGVPKDYVEAGKWYRKAADQGDAGAQNNLGLLYANGVGVPKDYVRANMWFNLSAAQGNQEAAKNQAMFAQRMTPAQIDEALKLASEWKPTKQQAR
jgi:uncharacterized protein